MHYIQYSCADITSEADVVSRKVVVVATPISPAVDAAETHSNSKVLRQNSHNPALLSPEKVANLTAKATGVDWKVVAVVSFVCIS